jgi:OOP family OmpA-OmpF porin
VKAFKVLMACVLTVGLAATAGVAAAQSKDGHWVDAGQTVWKDGSGQCWKSGYWTPAMAIEECDPDLVKKPARAAPRPAPAAKPAPKAKTLTITSTQLFAFNKSELSSDAKVRLDREVLSRLDEFATIQFINVYGHTDRIGSAQYNQKLSERRANAVKAYRGLEGRDLRLRQDLAGEELPGQPERQSADRLPRPESEGGRRGEGHAEKLRSRSTTAFEEGPARAGPFHLWPKQP